MGRPRKHLEPIKKSYRGYVIYGVAAFVALILVIYVISSLILIMQSYSFRSPVIFQSPAVRKPPTTPKPQKKGPSVPLVTPQATPAPEAIVPPDKRHVKAIVCKYFGADCEVATAVFRAESGLRAEAKGYNCYYTNDAGEQYSDACRAEDRARAWSVDCGIAQINVAGHECPTELLEEEGNIKRAYAMYERRGFQPWVAHNTGRHLAFLTH